MILRFRVNNASNADGRHCTPNTRSSRLGCFAKCKRCSYCSIRQRRPNHPRPWGHSDHSYALFCRTKTELKPQNIAGGQASASYSVFPDDIRVPFQKRKLIGIPEALFQFYNSRFRIKWFTLRSTFRQAPASTHTWD
jgi:hypothetical protein